MNTHSWASYINRIGAVGCGTAMLAGRSRVRFPMMSLEFFMDIILPAALWSGALESTQPLTDMSTRNTAFAYSWQPYHLHVSIVLKSWNPVQWLLYLKIRSFVSRVRAISFHCNNVLAHLHFSVKDTGLVKSLRHVCYSFVQWISSLLCVLTF